MDRFGSRWYAEEYYRRGLEAEKDGNHEKAVEFYERALNENPDHENGAFHLALLYDRRADDARAIELYERFGFLVAGLWTSLAVAALHRVEAPEPARRPVWEPATGLAAGAGVVAAVVVGVRADTVALYTSERPTFAVGALTIALLALALVTTVSAASTRGARQAR